LKIVKSYVVVLSSGVDELRFLVDALPGGFWR